VADSLILYSRTPQILQNACHQQEAHPPGQVPAHSPAAAAPAAPAPIPAPAPPSAASAATGAAQPAGVTLKVKMGEDLRRVTVPAGTIDYATLVGLLTSLFGDIANARITYIDSVCGPVHQSVQCWATA
jgi:hypothetical protein